MALIFKQIPGWSFDVDEVSAGVYKITSRDSVGHFFEKSGIDPNSLVEEAKRYALAVIAEVSDKNPR